MLQIFYFIGGSLVTEKKMQFIVREECKLFYEEKKS